MTTDDLIPLLENAGISQEVWFEHHHSIERFAALVAAAEQEEILKLTDSLGWVDSAAIRARGG